MAYLLKNNAVFLHIPKTGGSFIVQALQKLGLVQRMVGREHDEYNRLFWYDRFHHDDKVVRNIVRRAVGLAPNIDPGCFKFCFVRDPLSWYVSYWQFMQRLKWRRWGDDLNPYHWSPLAMLNGLGSPDFNLFVANVNKARPGFVTELYGWYVRPGMTFVGKTESLTADLERVLTLMKVDVDLGCIRTLERVNPAPATIPKPTWDEATRRETLRLEYAGCVRYGYPIE